MNAQLQTSGKFCSRCKEWLPLSCFHSRGGGKLKSACVDCTAVQRAVYSPVERCPADPKVLAAINNTMALWHGPVDRSEPLRWHK